MRPSPPPAARDSHPLSLTEGEGRGAGAHGRNLTPGDRTQPFLAPYGCAAHVGWTIPRGQHVRPGRVAPGAGELSGGVGPPRPVRSPEGCGSGEWVTQLESSPAPGDGSRPASRFVC